MSDDMQAIIIEGESFPWKQVHDHIDATKMWENRPHAAAAMSDPGICSCPRCHKHYWAEGIRQECPQCHAQYETDWWCMLSWGVQHGRILKNPSHPMHKWHHGGGNYQSPKYRRSAVFQWSVAHPDCSLDSRAVFKGTDWIEVWAGRAEYPKEGVMVGGKVIGIVRGPENTLLHVEDRPQGDGKHTDKCSVWCIEIPNNPIGIDDSVWWQAGKVYWTPNRKRIPRAEWDAHQDIPLKQIGYSH